MVVAADRSKTVERRDAHPGRGVRVRCAAGRRLRDRELETPGDGLGMLDEPTRALQSFHRQPRDPDIRLDRRIGHLGGSRDVADRALGRMQPLGRGRPDIDLEIAALCDDVGTRPARDPSDVDGDPRPAAIERVQLADDPGSFEDGAATLLRLDTGMGRPAVDGEARIEDALPGRHDVAVGAGALEDEARVDVRGRRDDVVA